MTSQPAPGPQAIPPDDVAAFLAAHPRFLAERPELYRRLAPPLRVHGEAMADHMAAMLRAERAYSATLAERADGVLAAGRAAAGLAGRVHEAVVALIAAADPLDFVASELPGLLAIDAAAVLGPPSRPLAAQAIARLLGSRPVLFRTAREDATAEAAERAMLHGEAASLARHDALVRVPAGTPSLLALAARDQHALDPTQGTGALAFLGRALAAALDR